MTEDEIVEIESEASCEDRLGVMQDQLQSAVEALGSAQIHAKKIEDSGAEFDGVEIDKIRDKIMRSETGLRAILNVYDFEESNGGEE